MFLLTDSCLGYRIAARSGRRGKIHLGVETLIGRGPGPVKQRTVIAAISSRANTPPSFLLPPIRVEKSPKMNVLVLLSLLFFVPFLFFLAYLALSSCMGDGMRARVGGMTFSRSYARGLGGGAANGGWEQIEMQDMLGEDSEDED